MIAKTLLLNFILFLVSPIDATNNSTLPLKQAIEESCVLPAVSNGRVLSLGVNSKSTGIVDKSLTGHTNTTYVLPGTEIFIFCHEPYRLFTKDDTPVVCLEGGTWTTEIGRCDKVVDNSVVIEESDETSVQGCELPAVLNGEIFQIHHNKMSRIPLKTGERVPAGTQIRLICSYGFELEDNGLDVSVCLRLGNIWTNELGLCKRRNANRQTSVNNIITCDREPLVRNGFVKTGKFYGVGARRSVQCHPGFYLYGPDHVQCSPNGFWTRPGACELDLTPNIVNRANSYTSPERNPQTNFGQRRPTRFELPPPLLRHQQQRQQQQYQQRQSPSAMTSSRVKSTSGYTQGFYPTHDVKNTITKPICVSDPYIPNGSASNGGSLVGDVRKVYCHPGNVLQGADSIVCSQYGHWSIPGHCVPASSSSGVYRPHPLDPKSVAPGSNSGSLWQCGRVPIVEGAEFRDFSGYYTTSSSRKKMICKAGYDLIGPDTIFCNAGTWSEPGICVEQDRSSPPVQTTNSTKPVECVIAKFVRNGRIAKFSNPDGGDSLPKLSCDRGYSVMGSNHVVCDQETALWKAVGYCLLDEYVKKLEMLKTNKLPVDVDERLGYGYSWDRAKLLEDDSGCFNPKTQNGVDGSFWSRHYPCPYENRLTCVWDIVAPERDYVAIAFNDIFYIEPGFNGTDECEHDSLSFYVESSEVDTDQQNANNSTEGAKIFFELAGKFCGKRRPKNMILASSKVRVVFRTDNRFTGVGFRLLWSAIRPSRLEQLLSNKLSTSNRHVK